MMNLLNLVINLLKWTFGNKPWIFWTSDMTSDILNLISEPLIRSLIWTLLWTFAMISETSDMNLWYEPYDMNLLIWHYDVWYVIWFPVWYPSQICFPSHEGNMAVSLMHQWHDSCVGEWFLTPSLICYLLWPRLFVCRGVWMHPRSVSV